MTTDQNEMVENPDDEVVEPEAAPEAVEAEEEDPALPSISEMKNRVENKVVESTSRMKEAGWRPVLDLFGTYAERIVDGFQGMADGFAGKRRDR